MEPVICKEMALLSRGMFCIIRYKRHIGTTSLELALVPLCVCASTSGRGKLSLGGKEPRAVSESSMQGNRERGQSNKGPYQFRGAIAGVPGWPPALLLRGGGMVKRKAGLEFK